MQHETRNAALAALAIMLVFGVGAFWLPTLILALGNYSTVAAGIAAVLFCAAFFMVFWLRGRSKARKEG